LRLASHPVVSYHTQRDSTRRRATTLMLYRPSARFDSDLGAWSVYVSSLTTVKTPETALGNNNSAQTSTQMFWDLGRSPLSTPSGRAQALFGQNSPKAGRASSLEAALVSQSWHAPGRQGHAHGSWATRLRGSSGHCGRRQPLDRHDSASNTFHNLRGCDRSTRHALERIRSQMVPKGLHVSC